MTVITVVSAMVETDAEAALVDGFRQLIADDKPDGLQSSQLLRGPGGLWQIQTVWRDREALDRMRAAPEPPAAPRLSRRIGADPTLQIFDVEASTADA